ncbi:MAG: hypothetical protein M3320_02040 [Actinomycetota bacterium]|nr:hypothetical protein [Actinomycetota bacterium]MDQ5807434.1 hypothetical protein [Actinomycetota bacterium]
MTAFGPEHEQPQARGGAESDAVTVAFGDPEAGLYGFARTSLSAEDASGIGLVFAGTEVEAVRTEGVRIDVVEPLKRWRATFEGGFDLELEALSPPVDAGLGDIAGYEQLCRVTGTAGDRRVDCLGQHGHSWGRVDWSKLELARTVTAWLDDNTAVTLSALRASSAKHHADETLKAHVLVGGTPVPVADPRLSTTYDAGGRQVHAGLELWVGDGDGEFPHRAAGEVVCGTTLDLGSLRLDCAFFEWHMEGRTGVGRYDIVRRAE